MRLLHNGEGHHLRIDTISENLVLRPGFEHEFTGKTVYGVSRARVIY